MSNRKRIVNVLCTLGPSSLNQQTIERLEDRGVDLFRINLSHTPLDKVEETVLAIQAHSKSTPICLDTEGAQVRTGVMEENVVVKDRQHVRLTAETVVGNAEQLCLTPPTVFAEMKPNNMVGLDFDGVVLLVLKVDSEGADTVVLNGGKVGSNKAVVIDPAPKLSPLADDDIEAVKIGLKLGIRHFALSFANCAEDVHLLRKHAGPDSIIISKIESKRGVRNLDEILEASDEILIDRGDLSREVPLESIPFLQKAIIRKANIAKKPVNVATNLLESMIVNRKPTRAELNDIINTLMDGANGLVLAAETAIGSHPVGAVDMVLTMIEHYRRSLEGYRIEDLLETSQSLLPSLHGQNPAAPPSARRLTQVSTHRKIVDKLPAIEVGLETAMDIEQIAHGVYFATGRLYDTRRAGKRARRLPPAQRIRLDHADATARQKPGVRCFSPWAIDPSDRREDRRGDGHPALRRQVRSRSRKRSQAVVWHYRQKTPGRRKIHEPRSLYARWAHRIPRASQCC